MGTLAVSFTLFCLCFAAVPYGDNGEEVSGLVAWTCLLSAIVFTARVLGFVVEWGGW